jgi:hypothetical protein
MKISLAAMALVALFAVACSENVSSDASVVSAAGEIREAEPITLENWTRHPKIVAVREMVDAIDAADFASESKELCAGPGGSGHGEVERTKVIDGSGRIRELVISLGSEDSSSIESHYYDAQGRLRFLFVTTNDVHGNASESRVYFDENGSELWDVYRHAFDADLDPDIEDAPYEVRASSTEIDPEAKDPAKLYDAPPRCD